VTPEAAVGGPIALIEDGDPITIDAGKRRIDLGISAEELERRRAAWTAPPPAATRGLLAKYARLVGSASQGAVTDG
jgi:dihydroxy-acid dehydratase